MILIRRSEERLQLSDPDAERWLTFHEGDPSDPLGRGFFRLKNVVEERIAPGRRRAAKAATGTEILTCVLSGTFEQRIGSGESTVLRAGEVYRESVTAEVEARVRTSSERGHAHLIELWLASDLPGAGRGDHRMTFAGDRDGRLQWVTPLESPKECPRIARARLDRGQHLAQPVDVSHAAWLQVVSGEVALGDLVLSTGDGAGLVGERSLSLLGWKETELLFADLGTKSSTD